MSGEPMKKGHTNLAQGTPEQLSKVKRYLLDAKEAYPEKKLKTHADAVIFAIEQAEKVPALEARIKELEKENGE